MTEYNASSIKILTAKQVQGFDWNYAEQLAKEYDLPLGWVKNGFEACRRINIDPNEFVARYITHDSDRISPEFQEVYKEVLREQRFK